MAYEDKTLECQDCGVEFTFSAQEQEYFASRGFENEPKRCPECRATRKRQRYGEGYGYQRQMYPAVCNSCGKDCEVPFQPRGDRPVYCQSCYSQIRTENRT